MTENIFEKWDKEIDTKGLQADVEESAKNGGQGNYKEVPHGDYEVAIDKMELKASKAGDPMVSIWFKIVSGEYKGSIIFYNQVITKGFQIHNNNELLRDIVSGMGEDMPEVKFETYKQYSNLLMDIFEAIDKNFEFALKYEQAKGDFSKYTITEVFKLED